MGRTSWSILEASDGKDTEGKCPRTCRYGVSKQEESGAAMTEPRMQKPRSARRRRAAMDVSPAR